MGKTGLKIAEKASVALSEIVVAGTGSSGIESRDIAKR